MQLTEDLKFTHGKVAKFFEKYYQNDINRAGIIGYQFESAGNYKKAVDYFLKASRSAHESYRADEALELYQKILKYIEENEEKANVYGRIAEIHELSGDFEKSYKSLKQGIGFCKQMGAELKSASLEAYMGEVLRKKGDLDQAIKFLDSAIKTGIIYTDIPVLGKAYLNLGKLHLDKGNISEAKRTLKKAYGLKSKEGDQLGKALSLYYLGVIKRMLNQFDTAVKYYKRAEWILKSTQNQRYMSYPIYAIGLVHRYNGQLKESEKYFTQCLTIYQEIGYRSGESDVLLNLGIICSFQGDYEESLSLLNQSLEISEKIGEKISIAFILFAIGALFYRQEDYKQSIKYFKKSLTLMKNINAKGYYGYVLSYLVCTYAQLDDSDKAVKAAYHHMNNIQEIQSDVENGRFYLGLAMAFSKTTKLSEQNEKRLAKITEFAQLSGKETDPEIYFQKAIATARQVNLPQNLIPALCFYGKYLSHQGNNEPANEYFNEAKEKIEEFGFYSYRKFFE